MQVQANSVRLRAKKLCFISATFLQSSAIQDDEAQGGH